MWKALLGKKQREADQKFSEARASLLAFRRGWYAFISRSFFFWGVPWLSSLTLLGLRKSLSSSSFVFVHLGEQSSGCVHTRNRERADETTVTWGHEGHPERMKGLAWEEVRKHNAKYRKGHWAFHRTWVRAYVSVDPAWLKTCRQLGHVDTMISMSLLGWL